MSLCIFFFCFYSVITELRSCDWNYIIDEYLWNILDFTHWPAEPKIVIIWLFSAQFTSPQSKSKCSIDFLQLLKAKHYIYKKYPHRNRK